MFCSYKLQRFNLELVKESQNYSKQTASGMSGKKGNDFYAIFSALMSVKKQALRSLGLQVLSTSIKRGVKSVNSAKTSSLRSFSLVTSAITNSYDRSLAK